MATRGLLAPLRGWLRGGYSATTRSRPAAYAAAPNTRRGMASAASGGGGSGSSGGAAKPIIRGIVFDMDGTLTVPVIDFALMRRRVGVTQGDILDVINSWPEAERQKAYATIAEIEQQALADMKLMPGLQALCSYLDGAGIPRGLITRNVKSSIEYFHDNHFVPSKLAKFEPAISRECAFPYKPSPAALLHICGAWGVAPGEVLMVGDSAKDDIVCGNRAGAGTILLDVEGRYAAEPPTGEAVPTHTVASMAEFQRLLQASYTLLPPAPRNG